MLGPVPCEREGWSWRVLENGSVLSHCHSLDVQTTVDPSGREWTLLGLAAQTEPGHPDPVEALRADSGDVLRTTRTWTGRWVLVGDGVVHQDAAALLGCFTRIIESGPNAGTWVSSSVALLAGLTGSPETGHRHRDLGYGVGIDWFPPPETSYPGIRRVLATQFIEMVDGTLTLRRKQPPQPLLGSYSTEELATAVEGRLITGMRNIAKNSSGPLWIALTAGGDSRLVLAAAHAAGVDARTYTQQLPFYRYGQGLADRDLPPVLAREVGMDHLLVKAGARSTDLVDLWDEHTAGQSVEADRDLFARRQWEAMPEGSTVIRAGLFEFAQGSEYDYLPPSDGDKAVMAGGLEGYASYFGRDLTDYQRAALSDWIDWMLADRESTVDWRDRFLFEQRASGWLGAIEQGLDITGRRSIQLANCTALLEELLTFDLSMKVRSEHHILLIDRMAPALLRHPINPDDGWMVKVAAKLAREAYRMANPGPGGYLQNMRHRLNTKLGGDAVSWAPPTESVSQKDI